MASLFKVGQMYYLQFHDSSRTPSKKRLALKTGNRRVAEQLRVRHEAQFALGDFDPWSLSDEIPKTLGEAYDAFIKRKANLRASTRDHYRWMVGRFVTEVGESIALEQL